MPKTSKSRNAKMYLPTEETCGEKKSMTTNKELASEYRRVNKKYFRNKLPDIPVRFAKLRGTILGRTLFLMKTWEPVEIEISHRLRPSFLGKSCMWTLYHEMTHVFLGKPSCYSRKFKDTMKALLTRGLMDQPKLTPIITTPRIHKYCR
jgi:hypothetical protein